MVCFSLMTTGTKVEADPVITTREHLMMITSDDIDDSTTPKQIKHNGCYHAKNMLLR